jgi:1,4-dihydroxy-2-naphthoyl-CoA synthase
MVAAVSGYAVAGGMELALMCDLRVIEETAIMGVFCRRFGKMLLCYLPKYNLQVLGKCLYSHQPGFYVLLCLHA